MDPDLRDLLAGQRAAVREWLQGLGVESCLDVRHLWPTAGTMQDEWSSGPGQGNQVTWDARSPTFMCKHFPVKPFRYHAIGHTATQAAEMQPWECLNLLRVAAGLTGTPRILALFLVQAASSCIRLEHVQRSRLVTDHHTWLEFRCSQGKSRRQGVRPAYNWATPPVKFQGSTSSPTCGIFCRSMHCQTPPFFWPGLQLSADDLWQVSEDMAFYLERKMSGPRFLEVLRGVLSVRRPTASSGGGTV